jgi:cell wall-associated NlpC family hydrolase
MRRGLGTLACSLALLASPLCASAAAAGPAPEAGVGALGGALLKAVVSSTGANRTIDALGNSLALMEARKRIAAHAAEEAAPAAAPKPPSEAEAAADPSKLPAASAGSNGTAIPHHASAEAAKIFAHTPAGGGESTSILLTGIALAPPDAPEAVKRVINNANSIVGRPYVWGGGHASFYSYGYDCSGSVSFALFGGGLIPRPLTSGELEGWGAPGPGKWITVYANAGHTFAEIAGLRWDTVGDARGTGPRWHLAPAPSAGFVVRHPPGY